MHYFENNVKGTVSQEFLLQVSFKKLSSPEPLITLGSFQIFPKIHGNICKSRCTIGINDTSGKSASCINDTAGHWHQWHFCHQCPWHWLHAPPPLPIKTLWCENHENPSDGKSHTWAPLKWTWRRKMFYLYCMSTRLPKGVQTKYLKLSFLKIFSICHLFQRHRWCTLKCEYPRLFRQNLKLPNGIFRGLGETDSWKKPKVENLWALSLLKKLPTCYIDFFQGKERSDRLIVVRQRNSRLKGTGIGIFKISAHFL